MSSTFTCISSVPPYTYDVVDKFITTCPRTNIGLDEDTELEVNQIMIVFIFFQDDLLFTRQMTAMLPEAD
jgi:hypothetical protein